MSDKKKKKKHKSRIRKHLSSIGFTNRLAVYLVAFLLLGLLLGFALAVMSIAAQYMGQLLCYTVVFTPIGTACSIVLNSIVNKSKAENTSGDGTGIKFAAAQYEMEQAMNEMFNCDNSCGFDPEDMDLGEDSPSI